MFDVSPIMAKNLGYNYRAHARSYHLASRSSEVLRPINAVALRSISGQAHADLLEARIHYVPTVTR